MSSTPERSIDHSKEGRAVSLDSIEQAFVRYGTPVGNLELLRGIAAGVGEGATLHGFRTYFKIERPGGGPALEVHDGYTTGFRSESDAQRLAGDRPRWISRRFRGAWGITHFETRAKPVSASAPRRAASAPRAASTGTGTPRSGASAPMEGKICMTCFMQMPLTGVCPNCG